MIMHKKTSYFMVCMLCATLAFPVPTHANNEVTDIATPETIATQLISPNSTVAPYAVTGEALVNLVMNMVNFDVNGASIVFNRPTGQLIVKNTPDNLSKIEFVLAQLREASSKQVQIEARIITIASDDIDAFGLQAFDFSSNTHMNNGTSFITGGSGNEISFPNVTERKNAANSFGQEFVFGVTDKYFNMTATIDALKSQANVNTLAAPQLTVFNNQRGHIVISKIEEYVSEVDAQVRATDQAIYYDVETTVKRAPSGTILDVTPTINNNGTITLALHPMYVRADLTNTTTIDTVSSKSATSSNASNTLTLPIFTQQSVDTTVIIPDGGVAIIGGLIDETENKMKHETPILSDLPLVGNLFKNKNNRTQKSYLVMFIKATSMATTPQGKLVR